MKTLLSAMCAVAALVAVADPAVTNMTVATGSSGLVTVEYELDEPAVVTAEFFNDGASLGGKVVESVFGDVWKKVGAGKRRFEFESARVLDGNDVEAGKLSVQVTAWPLTNPPDYMVADMGMKSGPESVRYYPAESYLPGGIGDMRYRSHKMLMRKIMAKDVVWTMGSLDVPLYWGNVKEPRDLEKPHEAQLDHNYYIGVFEVTVGQWQLMSCNFVTTGNIPLGAEQNPDVDKPIGGPTYFQIRECPMSWNEFLGGHWPDAPYETSFLGLLRTATGLDFDLPSEAEWEYAAKATHGKGEMGWDGKSYTSADIQSVAWTRENSGGIHPVGTKPANDWGLYDTAGNVCEWCLDWVNTFDETDPTSIWGTPTDITQLRGGVNIDREHPENCIDGKPGACRSYRGGSNDEPYDCQGNFFRGGYYNPGAASAVRGFRVACPALAK